MRETTCDRVPRNALAAAVSAPVICDNDPALDHRPIGLETLANSFQAEFVEPAERGEAGRGEGTVEHVEVFRSESVRTSILKDLDASLAIDPRPTTTSRDAKLIPTLSFMQEVHLTGQLVCHNRDEAELVLEHLPTHVELTTAEPGCLHFAVDRTSDPLVWHVQEQFTDSTAFNAHQRRVAVSEWGRATAGIERRYSIDGLTD